MRNVIILLMLFGIFDTSYLVYEHFSNVMPPCSINGLFSDCGKVLRSEYSLLFGIPLSLLGLFYYLLLFFSFIGYRVKHQAWILRLTFLISTFGAIFSTYLMYLQFFVLRSLCVYCTFSAAVSISIFFFLMNIDKVEFGLFILSILNKVYKYGMRRILFLFDSERIHIFLVRCGEMIGMILTIVSIKSIKTTYHYAGITFPSRVGLAAGFDYEARLPMITPFIGYGFHTVGTITNLPFEGNPKPRLGRLVKSRALMVNKGFKNLGADETIRRMRKQKYRIPVGVSIGKSNVPLVNTQEKAVQDIVACFKKFEEAKLPISYYELNISCPNLSGNVSFYSRTNLLPLLSELSKIQIRLPVFVKMPISVSDSNFIEICDTLTNFSFVKGVIIGNLQKDRSNSEIDPNEVKKWKNGSFSGKPTFARSNTLIAIARRNYKNRFVIIGCGGIFSIEDARLKIKAGADLIQMITGMVFEGPFRVKEMSLQLN